MATTADRIAELETAIATVERDVVNGIRVVQFGDRSITYSSGAEKMAALQQLRSELAALTRGRSRQTLLVGSKGF